MKLTNILRLANGAKFCRLDSHIHSFGGSHDVKNATMTPEEIVETAIAERLDLIAVADHNEINNVGPTVAASFGSRLLVVPATELSTAQGHRFCYLPTVEEAQ